ncbi:ATP-binding protein [Actinoplanes sichuanensis]|uniref:Sensor-like histidine kinase SenX3 n=1 Tax=Actinoplanes sichuanensis TaxID=512349 RepID=A0ABW4AG29_9ACTN
MEQSANGARRVTGPLLSVAVFLIGLAVTVLTAAGLYSAQRQTAEREMDRRHEAALAAIRTETERYRGVIETLAAGIVNDPELTWEDFDVATGPLVDAELLAAVPVAFLVEVPTADVEQTQRLWRERGAEGLTFHPDPSVDEHIFGVFTRELDETEPAARTGSDLGASEPLATNLRTARDEHRLVVSDPRVLQRDRGKPAAEQQQSFVFAVPVWTRENTPRFRGWVASGLRGGTFLERILGPIGQISGELVAVGPDQARHTVAQRAASGEPDLSRTGVVDMGPDQQWVLRTRGDARLLAGDGWYLPFVALGGGLVLTALLAWLVRVLEARARAQARAEAATADLREAEAASRRQAELLGAIMTTISDGVLVVDSQGAVLLENPAARRLLGVAEPPDGPEDWQAHYGVYRPDGRTPFPLAEMPLIRALDGESTDGVEVVIRNPAQPDGLLLTIDGRPLDPSAGEHGAVAVCRDITELRRYESDLAIFAGVVAHDLKSPLALIRGHAELVLDEVPDGRPESADVRDGLRRIVRAVDRMDALIETLLAYTTARDAPLRELAVDPGPMIREIIEERIAAAGGDRPPPDWTLGPLPAVRADPGMLRHVLDNLIGNAIKYVRPGGTPRVEVTGGPAGPGRVRIEVADSGIGIPDAEKPHVFETFHRTEAAAGYAGTGLGLTICRRIVKRHGGEIGVTDNPGGGTRFWFTLPAADITEDSGMNDDTPQDDEAVREALERALAERAAMMEAARLPGLAVPLGDPAPDRLSAPMPERQRQD